MLIGEYFQRIANFENPFASARWASDVSTGTNLAMGFPLFGVDDLLFAVCNSSQDFRQMLFRLRYIHSTRNHLHPPLFY